MTSLLTHLISQLVTTIPFTKAKEGCVLLLHPHMAFSIQEHHDALAQMSEQGLIHEFRYIDAIPTPSILAVRG